MFGAIRGRLKVWLSVGIGTIGAVLVAGLLGAFGALPRPPSPRLPGRQPGCNRTVGRGAAQGVHRQRAHP